MLLSWRNGLLRIGYLAILDAWGIELAWNRREDFGDPPREGEVHFLDYRRLAWWRGRWWPERASYKLDWQP